MKRRLKGGGSGVKFPLCDRILFRDIESLRKKNNYATIEQLVDDLRSTHPRHARHKLQPFTKCVDRVSNILNRGNLCEDDSYDNDDETPTKKLKRKMDQREEKLLLIEAQHIKRRSGDVLNNSTGSSSSIASAASSESSSEASDDAVYGEKLKPEFDLMKSMLRENYGQKFKELGEKREVQKAIELDVVENEDNKKVNYVNEGSKQGRLRRRNDLNEMNKNNKNSGRDITKSNESMFKDLGGMSGVIEELKKKVLLSFCNPQLPRRIGVKPVAGILLYGPPGCGKTKLAQAIANETKVPFYQISATELVSGVSGTSEENIRELFSKANRTAPSIVFIDEIDAIASKRENMNREMERRIVTQLLTSMDEAHKLAKPADKSEDLKTSDCSRRGHVLVIGATNRPDALDSALRRPGRFDREFELGVPDDNARLEILSVLTSNLIVDGAFDLVKIARSTPGFVGADLVALANEAGYIAIDRIIEQRKAALSKELVHVEHSVDWWRQPFSDEEMEKLCITMADFEEAVKLVQPSSRREGFSTIPNVKWDDVGGLHLLRREFDRYIIRRIKYPEDYEGYGVNSNTGFLLYGPPGCGKTLIAKAVANEAGANFIHIKGPELLNKYVGESELAVRTIFRRARTCSPCIIFFDEVDALTTKRGNEGGWVVERPLTQLLIELDGAEQRKGVYVIGATNRPEIMDRALLRPGRFGKLLYVPLPSPDDRGMILKTLARKKPIDADVDLTAIAKDDACSNFSGADLTALMDEALEIALEDFQAKKEEIACEDKQTSSNRNSDGPSLTIKDAHFKEAFKKVSPSVSVQQKQCFELLPGKMRAA